MSEPLKLALVGCGAISDWHRMGLEQVPELEITAVVDVDPGRAQAAAEATGARAFGSLEDALADGQFDAVDLMLPHRLHEPLAIQALEAGKHVLLEKPMAPSLDACERILEAAAKAEGVFMVAENAQYWPEVRIAHELIGAGAIGDVLTAGVHLFFPPMPAYYGGDSPWRFDKEATGGGVSIDTGSHYVRPLRMWLGEIDEVVAAMERPLKKMEGESLARALFRFRSGVVASFDLMLTEAPIGRQDMFRISGTAGEILIGLGVTLYDADHRQGVRIKEEEPQGYLLSYEGQFRDFARAALGGAPLEAGPEVSLGELRTALAMERSAASGRWEKVWE
ncbi:MAG: Gfo/Idh/MocA family oxidoreductase [Deltaproteobacteria bacterium]|nr:Gfo/Idh/MocA family oxidoreductase [Deltaproteobacteria bacterium]